MNGNRKSLPLQSNVQSLERLGQASFVFLTTYRPAVNDSTRYILPKVLFGKEMRLSCELVFGCKPGEDLVGGDCVTDLPRKMNDIYHV